MGFWSKVNPFKKGVPESALSTATSVGILSGVGVRRGNQRSVQEVLAATNTSPWFRSVIERVSFAAAVVPWRVFAVKAARGTRDYEDGRTFCKHIPLQSGESPEVRARIKSVLQQEGRLVEIADHMLLELMAMPNPALTGVDSRLLTFEHLNAVGETGWALIKNNLGAPIGYWPVPAHWIVELPTDAKPTYTIQVGSDRRKIPEADFILFRNPGLANPYGRGSGTGMALADELETDEYIAKFQNTWFHSRGKPDLVVTVKGQGLDQDQLQRPREVFENEYRDSTRGGRSMWIGGDVSVKELSQKLVDLDLTTQRTWIKDLAREVFGVPPEIMGDIKNSNRATVREAMAILAMLSTIPQLERMRAQLQQKLLPMYDDRLVVDYHSPMPSDKEFSLRSITALPYTATRGEIRKLQGLEDRGEYDNVHLMPLNVIEIGAPLLPKEKKGLTTRQLVSKAPLTDEEIERVLASLLPNHFARDVAPEIEATVDAWANREFARLGMAASFDMTNPAVLSYLDEFSSQRVVGINDTSKRLLRSTLRAGVSEGEGADALARRIRSTFSSFERQRALTIARTEVTSAANFGSFVAQSVSGVVEQREWLATMDDLVRDTHEALNGKRVGMQEAFVSERGVSAMYPGGFGVASEDVNCRCTTVANIDDPEKALSEDMSIEERNTLYKAFIQETDKDEARVARAARRAFRNQERIALEQLERGTR